MQNSVYSNGNNLVSSICEDVNAVHQASLTNNNNILSCSVKNHNVISNSGINSENDNVCIKCKRPIKEMYILIVEEKMYHEDCLRCSCCDARLAELDKLCYLKANMMLCKRDYLRLYGNTGFCAACDSKIQAFEYVMKAKNNIYHLDCFTCHLCKMRFCVGDKFYLNETNKILCEKDHNIVSLPHSGNQYLSPNSTNSWMPQLMMNLKSPINQFISINNNSNSSSTCLQNHHHHSSNNNNTIPNNKKIVYTTATNSNSIYHQMTFLDSSSSNTAINTTAAISTSTTPSSSSTSSSSSSANSSSSQAVPAASAATSTSSMTVDSPNKILPVSASRLVLPASNTYQVATILPVPTVVS